MICKKILKTLSISLILILISCKDEVFDKQKCTELLFKKYRNILTLNKTKLFTQNCKNMEIDYSMDICQKAFNQFYLGVKEKILKKRFGNQIMKCFSKGQIKKVKNKN